jgi:3-oxoisoapionate kinase
VDGIISTMTSKPATDALPNGLPNGLWLAYLGDDFTGSTDVMEAFTTAGVPTVLFLSPPTPAAMARFAHMRCVGMASMARAQDPVWMDTHLPRMLSSLKALGAPILQYKVCSTFDSSPTVGSIGRAVDIGAALMPAEWSPMIVGAPRLNRFQLFGHLFASVDGVGHRLDRHPTMSRHPVTPMDEADLRLHLTPQTNRRTALVSAPALKAGLGDALVQQAQGHDKPIVLIDVLDDETLREAGRLVWEGRDRGVFTASSSGLQYALAAYWRAAGLLPAPAAPPVLQACSNIVGVSGSCSPITAAQLAQARRDGFHIERLQIAPVLESTTAMTQEVQRLVAAAMSALARGASPIIASAEGPDDPAVRGFDALAANAKLTRAVASARVSHALAQTLKHTLLRSKLTRAVVAGGDTSGAVAGALGIDALTLSAALAPGAPMCHGWTHGQAQPVLEIALKGGQLGGPHFFKRALGEPLAESQP